MQDFRKLTIWKEGRSLVKDIYSTTKSFPRDELFGLTSQMRRAVVSIPANIAEGSSKNSSKDFKNYIHIAIGSLSELQTHLYLSSDLQLITQSEFEIYEEITDRLKRKLINFSKTLKT